VSAEGYLALAASAFGAATLLPLASEGVLAALSVAKGADALALWAVATAANSAGSAVNWGLGRFCLGWSGRRWFPIRPDRLERAAAWFGRFGTPSLLFAWLPVVGDPLTFAAGALRVPFAAFVALVALGKGARYAAVLWGAALLWP
jgi:membrane protein YqaA with SNARE-associated domain